MVSTGRFSNCADGDLRFRFAVPALDCFPEAVGLEAVLPEPRLLETRYPASAGGEARLLLGEAAFAEAGELDLMVAWGASLSSEEESPASARRSTSSASRADMLVNGRGRTTVNGEYARVGFESGYAERNEAKGNRCCERSRDPVSVKKW